jgi:hypothetical protein
VLRWSRLAAVVALTWLVAGCDAAGVILARPISAMNVAAAERLPGPEFEAALTALHDEGVRVVRSDAPWAVIQPRPPKPGRPGWRWTQTDAWVSAFARHGLTWEPILDYAVGWAKLCPGFCPPTSNSTFAAYARAVAARYGVGGTYWSEHPRLPAHPARVFEVWNEENVLTFYVTPVRYASLYAATRRAVRAVDPTASVIVGGLADDSGPFSARQDGPSEYVQAMFAAQPGLVRNVDGFSLHPYGFTAQDVEEWVVHFRQTLDDLGEARAPIYVTEFGWPTGVRGGELWRARQMSFVAAALSRSNCSVRLLAPYDWVNPGMAPSADFGLAGPGGGAPLRPAGVAWFRSLKAHGPELRVCPAGGA